METKNKDSKPKRNIRRKTKMLSPIQMKQFVDDVEERFDCTCVGVIHEPTPKLKNAPSHVDLLLLKSNDISKPSLVMTMGASACPLCPFGPYLGPKHYIEMMMEVPTAWMPSSDLDNLCEELSWVVKFMNQNKCCLFKDNLWFEDFISVESSPFASIKTFYITGPCMYTKDFIMPVVELKPYNYAMIWQFVPLTDDEYKWFAVEDNLMDFHISRLIKIMMNENIDISDFNRRSVDFNQYRNFLGFTPEGPVKYSKEEKEALAAEIQDLIRKEMEKAAERNKSTSASMTSDK